MALDQTDAFTGSSALRVSGRSAAWNGAQVVLNDTTFYAGKNFVFSAAVSPSKNVEMMLSLQYTKDEETVYDHLAAATVKAGKWTVLAADYTIPEGAEDPVLYVESAAGTANFSVDDVFLAVPGTSTDAMPAAGSMIGDLDGNDQINALDSMLLKQYLLQPKLSAPDAADIDGNATLEAADFAMLTDYLFCKRTSFPERTVVEIPDEPDPFVYDANLQYHDMPGSYKSDCAQQGRVVKLNYTTSNRGAAKYANVYLPYGYDESDTSQKYNVFYLMHGGGENQDTIFSDDVNFKRILDNMIQNGDIDPMIVVTPTFNNTSGSDMTQNAQTFHSELVKDIIPAVEGKYHTYAESTSDADLKASRGHRAFGGFSMGGLTTWYCFLNTLDYVQYYMPLSGDCWAGNTPEQKAAAVADAAKKSGYSKDEYFVLCATGTKDIAYDALSQQVEAMKKLPDQFDYTSDFSKGNFYFLTCPNATHWWGYVVHYIYDALPYFFHE